MEGQILWCTSVCVLTCSLCVCMQEVPLCTRSSQRLADSCPHEQGDSGPCGRPASLNNQQ